MTWTNDKPTKPGWWWIKQDGLMKPRPVFVEWDSVLWIYFDSQQTEPELLSNVCLAQWSDEPIPEPQETKANKL